MALVAAGVNLPALVPGFIHDDHRIIEQNELVRSLARLPEIVSSGYWSVGETRVPNLYRPLTIASFALNHAAGGLHPFGYRLINWMLHVGIALLVFSLARWLTVSGSPDPPLVAALLFAVHPVHAEVLGEVIGRAELLAAAGTLGCVLAFLGGRAWQAAGETGKAWRWYGLALACFVTGFLSKENAIVAPALALLADALVRPAPAPGQAPGGCAGVPAIRGRPAIAWRFHLAAAAALVLCLALRAWALGAVNPQGLIHFVDNPIAHAPFLAGRLTALGVLARYAGLLVAPLTLSIDYSYDAIPLAAGILDPAALLGAALVASWALAVAVAWRRRATDLAFALGFTGLALAPVANLLVPIGTIMAERLLYLPSAGACLLAGAAAGRLGDRPRARMAAAIALALALAALSARSVVRLRDWRDDYSIFKAAVAAEPASVRVQFNYGAQCEERGDDAGAVGAYLKAIALWPGFADAHYNLAGIYARQRRWDEAVAHYQAALAEEPGNVRYLVNLGHALVGRGRNREAQEVLRRALEIDPDSDQAYTNLGAAALGLGDAPGAVEAYRQAVRLVPGSADYLANLGTAQEQAGDPAAAAEAYREALAARRGDPDLLAALGKALLATGDRKGALEALARAVTARPGQPIFRYQFGRALERNGRLGDAAAEYREAIRLAPAAAVPRRALGLLLDRMGDRKGALEALDRAAALDTDGTVMDDEARQALASLRRAPRRGP